MIKLGNFFREMVACFNHHDCTSPLKCVVGYCGDPTYLDALYDMECTEDQLCDDLLLGPECCLDIAGGVERLVSGDLDSVWGKKCCDNIAAPVTIPPTNISIDIANKVDITYQISSKS